MADDPRVQQLLDRLLDSDASPEEVCESWPELLPVVRHRWRQMHRLHAHLDALFPAPDDLPPWPLQEAAFPSIPGYEVEAILGRGGMGVVFKARHLRLNRTVAIKTLLGGGFAGPRERERFQREAETVAALRHPNVVQLYDVGEEEGRPYFTMEFVEGGSLALKLAGSPQPARPSADLVSTLADAVHAAHRGGIVHRDLKPGNVLLAADGTPKISDFGLARRLEGGAALTLSGVLVGTPSYMAPEQALGRAAAVGPATDVYALGAILYELLTGRPPFRAATGAETVQQVISQEPAPPSRLNAQVPRDLETICLKCLHKEPVRRYGSAEELADDLRRFGEGWPIQARRVGWWERTWRWCRRNPTGAALTAALLVPIFMAVGGGLWLGRQSAERQGRAREAIEAVLAQVPGLRRQGRWPEAESILAQGRSRLVEAGSVDLRRQLAQAEKDLRLAAELERIRLTPPIEDNRFDYQGMAAAYAQAFAHAGLDVQGDIDTVSARIRSSDLRPQLVMALDHWVYVADGLGDTTSMTRLLGLARRADPDPRWGDRFRSPALWRDDEALRRLAAEVQAGLDRTGPENGPPTPLVALLAKKLGQKDGQAEPLLRAAQVRHPEDFWLNYGLGEALRERKPAEAVGFYRAALATRPTVAPVHMEISVALLREGQANEAILASRKAVELDPKDGRFHFYLGECLHDGGRFTEAIVEFRRSIELDPRSALFHLGMGQCLQARGRIKEALGEFRRSIELDPKLAASYHYVGKCLQAKGRIDEAMGEFRRSIELAPKD